MAVRKFWRLLVEAGSEFVDDSAVKFSASLSYYTVFSLGPMLLVVISLVGIFFGRDAIEGRVHEQIAGFVGESAALQIQDIIVNLERSQFSRSGAVIGFVMLFMGATGVFTEMQDSINYIWSIRSKPKRGMVKWAINRLTSFSLVVSLGFLLMVSLLVHTLADVMRDYLTQWFDTQLVMLFQVVNYVILFSIITLLFAIIFRVLPDARIRWRDSFVGAMFTAVLFLLGKFAIGFYLSNSDIGVTYGAAASIVVILLWVYYSSIILYFGAEFTKVYALREGGGIVPDKTAVRIIKREESEVSSRSQTGDLHQRGATQVAH